jgi:hydrogenase expression/formation protein HypC
MCIGKPARVLRSNGEVADVDVEGRVVAVSLVALDEPARIGDWLLVHSGIAISRLSDHDVRLQRQLRGER